MDNGFFANGRSSPLPVLATEVETLAARVDAHLKRMGGVWN
jgi:hypothetical protein